MMKFFRLALALSFLFACAGCGSTPATPAVNLTPTKTRLPSRTPRPSATAAPTSTPEPTAAPLGFFDVGNAGFSLTAPEQWKVNTSTNSLLILNSPDSNLSFYADSQAFEANTSMEEWIEQTIQDFGFDPATVKRSELETVHLAENVPATRLEFSESETEDNSNFQMQAVMAENGNRKYRFIFVTRSTLDDSYQRTIQRILESIVLFTPRPFDQPRSEIIMQLSGEPDNDSMDPALTEAPASYMVGLLFSGLVRLTPDLKIKPDLAEGWEISPDGTRYTFHLPADLKFSSGKAITAQVVKDGWERTCSHDLESNTALTYLGDIKGVAEKLDGKADEINGVKVIDEFTLEVTLTGPRPYFLQKLAYPTAYVYDAFEAELDAENWTRTASASGPYQIQEWNTGDSALFSKNPNSPHPPSNPYLGFLFHAGGSLISLYEEGTLDILSVSSNTVTRVQRPDDPLNPDLKQGTTLCTTYLQVNPVIAPLNDPYVRKALALAIDRDLLVKNLMDGQGLPAYSILPPIMPGYLPDPGGLTTNREDPRKILEKSHYADNMPVITLTMSGYMDSSQDLPNLLAEMWREKLGIEVQVEYRGETSLVSGLKYHTESMAFVNWCADYPDPQNFLDILFHSDSEFNSSNLRFTELDGWLEEAREETSPEKRLLTYQKAEKFLLDENYAIPLMNYYQYVLVKPRVKGYILSPLHARYADLLTVTP